MSSCELDDFSSRSTDTTSNVKDFHSRFDTNVVGKVMFVSSDSLMEGFSVGESTEMKTLRPSVLVEICGEIVVSVQSARICESELL